MCEECKIPLWETDDAEYMRKVKKKYAPKLTEHNTDLTVMLVFKSYCMEIDGLLKQGYYAKMFANNIEDDEK